jgi:hypothetical protein
MYLDPLTDGQAIHVVPITVVDSFDQSTILLRPCIDLASRWSLIEAVPEPILRADWKDCMKTW